MAVRYRLGQSNATFLDVVLRPPLLEALAIHANRLLKFKAAPVRNRLAQEQLVKRYAQLARPTSNGSANTPRPQPWLPVEEWPQTWLEAIHYQLWLATLQTPYRLPTPNDLALHGLVLQKDLAQTDAAFWLDQEVNLACKYAVAARPGAELGISTERFFSLNGESNLQRLAAAYDLGFDNSVSVASITNPTDYLELRWQQYPLPWEALLSAINKQNPALLTRLPLMAQLQASQLELESKTPAPHSSGLVPIYGLILVEGVSEELWLPACAKAMGLCLQSAGILVKAVGGKNQMSVSYATNKQWFKGNIAILLDADARHEAQALSSQLRPQDTLTCLQSGELEDAYHWQHVLTVINTVYQPYPRLGMEDLEKMEGVYPGFKGLTRIRQLEKLWRHYKLGPFDKALLAQHLTETIHFEAAWVHPELASFITTLHQQVRSRL